MRVLELTAHVQRFSRGDGRSATAAAAYRACDRIACEREGRVHDYRAKTGLEASGIVLPADAPAWAGDRSRLWNAVELRERNGRRGPNVGAWKMEAMVAREVLFGFPAELSAAGRVALAGRIARHLVETHGVAVDWAIHAPGKLGDQRNHHCHMMFTTRRLTASGLGAKTREWNAREGGGRVVAQFRATIAGLMNAALAEEGHGAAVHVEHRSLAARGIGRAATKHQGPGRTNTGRKRQARERAGWEQQSRHDQAARHERERAEQARDLLARAEARGRDIDGREARAIEAARAAEPAEPAPPPTPGRLTRIFRALSRRAEADRQPVPPAPADHARATGEIWAAFQAERERIAGDHGRDREALDERHRGEDRQLDRAAVARAERDRVEEVLHRRDQAEGRQHDRTRERQHDWQDRGRRMGPG